MDANSWKMPDELNEDRSCGNTTVQCIWHQKGS